MVPKTIRDNTGQNETTPRSTGKVTGATEKSTWVIDETKKNLTTSWTGDVLFQSVLFNSQPLLCESEPRSKAWYV